MLLDLNDPNRMGLLSLGLRLMSTPGKFGQALGQSGLGALGDMQQIKAQNEAGKDRDMRRKLLEQQQMMADLQLAQARQAQEKRAAIEGAYQGAMVSPAQQALAGGGGPTIANAQAMQGMVPKIDQNKLIQGLMQADPMTAYQMMQPKQSDYKVVGGSLVKIGGDGNVSEAYRAPKEVNMNDLMIPDGKGGFMVNLPLLQAKRQIASAGAARINTGQKDRDWGTPPKDYVWARDASGEVMTERDPKTGAFRPIATPIGGGDQAGVQASSIATMTDTLNTLDKAIAHPGRETATGVSGVADPRNFVPGTNAMNFKILADQIGGKAFLQAFESLKGGGQITETEGKKATDAIARLNRAQSDEEYLQALQDFRDVVAGAYKRATGKDYKQAGPAFNPNLGASPGAPRFLGFEGQ